MWVAKSVVSASARRTAQCHCTRLVSVELARTLLVLLCLAGLLHSGHAAAEDERVKPCAEQDTEIVNITKAELLRRAMKCVTTGFVPPILARMLYHDVQNSSWGPWDTVTTGWSWELPSDLPKLTSRRESGPFGRFEVVRTEARWFARTLAAEDYSYVLEHAGLSAASPEHSTHDPLLRHGPPSDYKMESRPLVASLQDPLLRKASFGVRVVVAPRSEAALPPAQLSDAAVTHLKGIRQLLRQGDAHLVHNASLDFFRRFGTHHLPGPVLFGGMLVARSGELAWKQAGTDDSGSAREHADCALRAALAGWGAEVGCNASAAAAAAAGYFSAPPCVAHAVRGGHRRGEPRRWLESVLWGLQPSSSWSVVDRGAPVPLWAPTLLSVRRDPDLTRAVGKVLEEAYTRLWQGANPLMLHQAAAAGDTGAIRVLVAAGVEVEGRDEEGRTALHHAAWAGEAGAIRALVERGARVGRRDRGQASPLHLAAAHDHPEACAALLAAGADSGQTDGQVRTALQLARSTRSARAEEVLRRHHHAKLDEL